MYMYVHMYMYMYTTITTITIALTMIGGHHNGLVDSLAVGAFCLPVALEVVLHHGGEGGSFWSSPPQVPTLQHLPEGLCPAVVAL